jgi:glutamine amidotransferase
MSRIAVVDYGMGNIHSVRKALEAQGGDIFVSNDPALIAHADKVVLPGVGAFGDAMEELERQNLVSVLIEHILAGKVFLGICLGMHLLFDSSEESLGVKGLGILKGQVKKFDPRHNLKVPHMGWNQIKLRKPECPLFKELPPHPAVYFCHSFYPEVRDREIVAASTEYGTDFASIIWRGNVFAMQFHPEKSQGVGLKIVENFVKML